MPRIPAVERRDLIIDAALDVMARDGVAATTTRAIMAEAGMPLASFHYCFTGRDEMLAQLIGRVVQREATASLGAMAVAPLRASTPQKRLRSVLRRGSRGYLDQVAANPAHELVLYELRTIAVRTPALRHLAVEQDRTYYAAAGQVLRAAAEQVGVRWSAPLPHLARLVITTLHGATATWLVDRDTAATLAVLDSVTDVLVASARA